MSIFQQRHYEAIAEMIRKYGHSEFRENLADVFCRELQQENPRFKPERFLAACRSRRYCRCSTCATQTPEGMMCDYPHPPYLRLPEGL